MLAGGEKAGAQEKAIRNGMHTPVDFSLGFFAAQNAKLLK